MALFNTPILFLVFNRLETTKRVFEQIKKIKPSYLFIAADGPRLNKVDEDLICNDVRRYVLDNIDWDCEIKTLFRNENLGCGKAVSQAITWFFENVERGIILEDDCLPDISFFRFCSELLEKFSDDEDVMCISGTNLLGSRWKRKGQSYFWSISSIWGWASWKRAWKMYDYAMEEWQSDEVQSKLRNSLHTEEWFKYYQPMFEETHKGLLDTWDVQWLYTILMKSGLSITPEVNLIKNIGFGNLATHTHSATGTFSNLATGTIDFPLKHPLHKDVDIAFLKKMHTVLFPNRLRKPTLIKRGLNFLSRL